MTIFPPKWQVHDICEPPINHKGLNWDSNGWLCNILMPITLASDIYIYIFIWAIANLFINLFTHSSKSIITRHSENDNTPQPLDQWMNSPFIGQQFGNCKSFTLTPTWPIYLPCTVAQGQSHCASNIITNSHPFHSKWADPPIPE